MYTDMKLTEEEQRIKADAERFARKNKKQIARRLTDTQLCRTVEDPVSVFMAGSPGAGKTEASIELIELLSHDDLDVLRIDADELRQEFPSYTGVNSWLFQSAVSILVEKIHDMALSQHQNFILDGTLTNYEKSRDNIDRSLKKGRMVQILYVYQDPCLAWEFVQARELEEGRRIQPEVFLEQYFAARQVVNRLKAELGSTIKVDLLLKNLDNSHRLYKAGIDRIDNHVPEKYDPASLRDLLHLS